MYYHAVAVVAGLWDGWPRVHSTRLARPASPPARVVVK